MPTKAQLESALKNAHNAGNTQAAKRLANAIKAGEYDDAATPDPEPAASAEPQPTADSVAQPTPEPTTEEMQSSLMGGNLISKIGRAITGEGRTTEQIQETPGLLESGIIANQPLSKIMKLATATAFTNDPDELATIFTNEIPELNVVHQLDAEGNPYPILVDQQGRTAIVDKPGMDMLNASQFLTQMAAFTPAGRAQSVAGAVGKEAMTEAAIQGGQQAMGGQFDTGQVALAGGLGGGGKALEKGVGATYRAATQTPGPDARQTLEASERFGVPVMTSDIAPPRTAVGQGARVMSEQIPIVGTGSLRSAQQDARNQAIDQFVQKYQGGTYEGIVQSLKNQRQSIKQKAGQTYDTLVPKLNRASEAQEGIAFNNTKRAIDQAADIMTREGRKTSQQAINILDDIQSTISGRGQTFGTVKSNINAWTEALNSIDPAVRSQLTSEDKAALNKVISAMRQDRDQFARANLTESEYRRLKNADSAYGEMANTLKNTRIKGILDRGDATPETAKNMLFSSKESEVRNLYKSLDQEGRNNARAVIIEDIISTLSRRANGLSPDSLATELKKRRTTTDVFFRDDRKKELEGLVKLLDATRRAQTAGQAFTIPTGQQTIPWIATIASMAEPSLISAFGTVGGMGRVYESKPVRTILARMSAVEPGTTGFEKLTNMLQREIQSAVQATKSEED